MLAKGGGERERQAVVQTARRGHGINRARDILVADIAGLLAGQVFFDDEGVKFLDERHGLKPCQKPISESLFEKLRAWGQRSAS